MKLPCCKNFYLDVNRKGIYFIWVPLKSRNAELEKLVRVNSAKHGGMFCREITATIKDLFSNTKLLIFRIPKNQKTSTEMFKF